MEDFFNRLKNQLRQDLPFVIYNKPNHDKIVGYFQKNDRLYFAEDFDKPGFVFAPFDGKEVVLIPQSHSEIIITDWISEDVATNERIIQSDLQNEKATYEALVSKGIAAILNGEFQKVVLSRKETLRLENFEAIATFKKLASTYPTAFIYCFFHPKIGMWFGASPEQLLKVKTNAFETIALAGTQKFEGNEEVDWGNKEKEEQQMVTDFIMENLESVTSDIAFSNPYTYKAGNLLHIKTDISGVLNDSSDVKQLVEILHPTPAVCGLPKEAARKFILENEGYNRKYYSGYLGELDADFYSDNKTTDLFVNLRCMEIGDDSAIIYVGCGITKDSIPEKEFEESVNKSMTMKKILN